MSELSLLDGDNSLNLVAKSNLGPNFVQTRVQCFDETSWCSDIFMIQCNCREGVIWLTLRLASLLILSKNFAFLSKTLTILEQMWLEHESTNVGWIPLTVVGSSTTFSMIILSDLILYWSWVMRWAKEQEWKQPYLIAEEHKRKRGTYSFVGDCPDRPLTIFTTRDSCSYKRMYLS